MKKTNKNMNMGLALGMCFGVSIGSALGLTLFDGNIAMGTSIGLSLGMAIGVLIGSAKDKEVNKQLEEKGYTITAIDDCKVTLVNINGEELVVDVPKGTMETEKFAVGDVVFMDEDGDIEQAFDEDDE